MLVAFGGSSAVAQSDASYPDDWKSWTLVKETVIPDASTPLPPEIPPLFVDTIKTYNWINDGKGTQLDIYVNPVAMDAWKARGPFPDGGTAVGVFKDVGIVFVTEHIVGQPIYGCYSVDGKDVSKSHPSFDTMVCGGCHVGYRDTCKGGICTGPVDEAAAVKP